MNEKTISAVVPVYNEERTVSQVLKALSDSNLFKEIICVNDGSTDDSVTQIKKNENVILIDYKRNRGKGYALSAGIERASGDFVAFFDADLAKLNLTHIQKMVDAITKNSRVNVLVAYERGEFLSLFSGQRIYKRKDLVPLLKEMQGSKYGVEVLLNAAFKDKKIKYLRLKELGHVEKLNKYDTKVAVQNYLNQWFLGVLKQSVKSGLTFLQFKQVLSEMSKYLSLKLENRKSGKYKKH